MELRGVFCTLGHPRIYLSLGPSSGLVLGPLVASIHLQTHVSVSSEPGPGPGRVCAELCMRHTSTPLPPLGFCSPSSNFETLTCCSLDCCL